MYRGRKGSGAGSVMRLMSGCGENLWRTSGTGFLITLGPGPEVRGTQHPHIFAKIQVHTHADNTVCKHTQEHTQMWHS